MLIRNSSQRGCVAEGGCHAIGSGGFAINTGSSAATYDEVREPGDDRVDLANPANSLLLRKPTNSVPHSGGQKWAVGDDEYNKTLLWIQQGAAEN